MEFFGFLFFLAGTLLLGILLFVVALILRPFRRYFLLSFLTLPSALFLLGFINTILLDNACGPGLAFGPGGEQSFQYCAAAWPDHAVYPLWLLSTAIVWGLIYLFQRWLNRRHPFFGGINLPGEPSKMTTLKL
jgi:hypothetical protein